jgi:cytochrome c-type biogenesis protein CcmH
MSNKKKNLLYLSLFPFLIFGCINENDLSLEQRSYQLSKQIMCPICEGQTLDQSQSQLSKDMKISILNLLDEGKTNKEIRDFFANRYGEEVLASPPQKGFNIFLWIVPSIIFLTGILIIFNAYKNMKKTN